MISTLKSLTHWQMAEVMLTSISVKRTFCDAKIDRLLIEKDLMILWQKL